MSVISAPRRWRARSFSPLCFVAGSLSHSAIIVSKATGDTVRPWRSRIMQSNLAWWATLGMVGSRSAGPMASTTRASGNWSGANCAPPAKRFIWPLSTWVAPVRWPMGM